MESRRLGALVAIAALVLAGCAQRPDRLVTTVPSSVPSQSAPAGAQTLRSLGLSYGPDSLLLPPDLRPERTVDQANVVSLFFRQPTGAAAAAWFRSELPRAGFTITSSAGDSLVFSGDPWSGALTTGPDGLCGLTLRRQP